MLIDRDVDGKKQVIVLQKSKSKTKKTDDIDDVNMDTVDDELTASVESKLKVTDDEKINVKENIVDDADDVDDKESGVRKKKKKKKKNHEDGTNKNVKDVDNLPVDTDDEKSAVPVQNKLKTKKRKNKNFDNVGSSSDEKKENEKTATKKIAAAPTKKESGTTVPATESSSSKDSSDEEEKLVKNPIAKKNNKVAKKDSTMDINDGEVVDPVKSRSKAKNKKPANQIFFEKLEKLSEKNLSNEVKEILVDYNFDCARTLRDLNDEDLNLIENEKKEENVKFNFLRTKNLLKILVGIVKKDDGNYWENFVSEESETDDSDDEPSTVTKDFMNLLGVTTINQSIQSGYYVDKTRQIQRLIEGKGHYFLIRPRRFGKTLMLDTAAVICEGKKNKKLFKNTHIGRSTTYQWKKHPVFQFTFSKLCKESIEEFKLSLIGQIKDNCRKYNIKLKKVNNIATLVKYMLNGGANLKNGYDPRVIVLIDEYDAPLNRCYIDKSEVVNILTDFFENLKGGHEKVVLTTGASRFGLSEVLTAANDICDITLAKDFNEICGFTQSELTTVFNDKIIETCTLLSIKKDQLLNEMKQHYNGFKFSEHAKETVYNPWSVIQCFLNNAIRSYWDGKNLSDYSSLLLNDCESLSFILEDPKFIANGSTLTFDKDFKEVTLKSLLFQTGYLTIQEYNKKTKMYILKVPNNETKSLLKEMMERSPLVKNLQSNNTQLFNAIIHDDFSQLVQSLRVYYAGWPYHAPMCEASAHIFFHAILTLLCEHTTNITFKSERSTRTGRCDVLLQTSKYSYIIELKFSKPTDLIKKTARQAITQIHDNKYYVKDLNHKKIIIFIGIVVDSRDIIDWERIYLSEYTEKVLKGVAPSEKQTKLQPAINDENSLKNKKEHGGNSRGGNFDNKDADKTAAESTPNNIAKNNDSNGFNSNKPAKDDENWNFNGNRRGGGNLFNRNRNLIGSIDALPQNKITKFEE